MTGSLPSTGTQPKTVLHIFSGDLWAGAEVMVYNLLSKLKNYPEVNVVALSLNEGILTGKLRNNGIETHGISESNYSFPQICLKALKLFKKRKIDVIHSHRYKENLLALILGKKLRANKLIATMHGLFENPVQGGNGRPSISFKTKADYFLLNSFFTNIIAVSKEMQEKLIYNYGFKPEKISVIYNGIPIPQNLNLNLSLKSNGTFHIGTVGRLVPIKGFELFLEIAAEIRKQMDNVHFSILGDGPLKDELTQKAKDLKLNGCLEFLPMTPDPMPYYQSLDLYLNTSHHEGIPLSILEAMVCGVPVVAPKVGGIPEIISDGENGILIEGREPNKIANSCLRVIQDKNLKKTLGEKASKRIASYFSKTKMAQCYHRLYILN